MKEKELNNELNIGGSIDKALKGTYSLSAINILDEAVTLTTKQFWRFLPAMLLLFLANVSVWLVVISLAIENPSSILQSLGRAEPFTLEQGAAMRIASFCSTVICAPLYAGASLMGLSHAIGFDTKPRHLLKGLAYASAITFAILVTTSLQTFANYLLPLLGLYFGIAFSMTPLLVCEKEMRVTEAMWVSLRAVTKKLLPLCAVYVVIAGLFVLSLITVGLALFWALPFLFNVKGIVYREMFGVGISVTVAEDKPEPFDDEQGPRGYFDA
ncbi:hypothetical protein [Veronia pacifica]|uniref:Uncharacterized protein n=1 Tax=Veronia pacifica TaxID=1080227 RepID=A0A1C3EES1_9GAMM|nr:hypothetical protein [Veronia pacifica]ODA31757.1 hypothetical protein A8L45_15375 [Veronia pacifica]